MTVETVTTRPAIYTYSLISWGSVWAGVAVAIALGVLLTILGAAIGATAFNPYDLSRAQAQALTIGGGLWIIFSNLVALQVGGFVAARTARAPDHMKGMMQGLAVWAVAVVASLALAGFSLSGGFASGGSDMAADASAANAAAGAVERMPALTPSEAAETARMAKRGAEALAWWTFAAMTLGAVGALAGGRIGSEHPPWPDRPRELRTLA
jgi:hypothetical protein